MKKSCFAIILLLVPALALARDKGPVQGSVAAPVDMIKSIALSRALSAGFMLESEGQFQLVFTKNMGTGRSMLTQLMVTPSACYSIQPRDVLTMAFIPGNPVQVTMIYQYEHAGPFCQRVREQVNGGKIRQGLENLLSGIRSGAEQQTRVEDRAPSNPPVADGAENVAAPAPQDSTPSTPSSTAPKQNAVAPTPERIAEGGTLPDQGTSPAVSTAPATSAPPSTSAAPVVTNGEISLGEAARIARAKKAAQSEAK